MPPRVKFEGEKVDREVVYPCVQIVVCGDPKQTGIDDESYQGYKAALAGTAYGSLITVGPAIDAPGMMALIGWETEADGGESFGDDFVLQDRYNRKVRLKNNPNNRPLSMSNVESIVQNVLQQRYELNGETLIVGEYGNVLNGQHTAVAVILADQDRVLARDKESKKLLWEDKWPEGTPVSISKIIVYGIKESDAVINTIDTAKPRSLADVLYRSPYFSDLPKVNKKTKVDRYYASRTTDAAIKYLWVRTGLYMSNTSKVRTNSEAVAWLEAHGGGESKLLAAVRFMLKENRGKGKEGEEGYVPEDRISGELSLGQAAAFMYLMACSNSTDVKVNEYYGSDDRTSAPLTWGLWAKARAFWEAFMLEDGPLAELTRVFSRMTAEEKTDKAQERRYMLAKAWLAFKADVPIEKATIKVKYKETTAGSGIKKLDWTPSFGGIDLGDSRVAFTSSVVMGQQVVNTEEDSSDPTPEVSTPESGDTDTVTEGEQSLPPAVESAGSIPDSPEADSVPTSASESTTGKNEQHSKESLIQEVRTADPRVTDVLVAHPNGKSYMAWGEEQCKSLKPFTKKKASKHLTEGLVCIAFPKSELDKLVEKMTDSDRTVVLVSEVDEPEEGEDKWMIDKLFRPGKGKGK